MNYKMNNKNLVEDKLKNLGERVGHLHFFKHDDNTFVFGSSWKLCSSNLAPVTFPL